MKLIDRYVLVTFVRDYLVALLTLLGLYVVLDMAFNFNDLVAVRRDVVVRGGGEAWQVAAAIADYYAHQCLMYMTHLGPVIPVVAAAFTLVRLTRFNELTALMAAGVPLQRVAAPIVAASVLVAGLSWANQELVIPELIPKLTRKHDDIARETGAGFPIRSMVDAGGAVLVASWYHPPGLDTPAAIDQLDVIYRDEHGRPTAHLSAQRAVWDRHQRAWALTDGELATGLTPEAQPGRETGIAYFRGSITPDEVGLYRSSNYVDLLSTARINQLLTRPQIYASADLLRVKHSRLAQIVLNVVVVTLAIPFVLRRNPVELKAGAIKAALVVGVCLGFVFACQQAASHPPGGWLEVWWPALMAWLPVMVFGPTAVVMYDRIRS